MSGRVHREAKKKVGTGLQLAVTVRKTSQLPKGVRNVVLVRTAERVDRVFPEWLSVNVTHTGEYLLTDVNLPSQLFQRHGGLANYDDDSPITELGQVTAQMLGRGLTLHGVKPVRIFTSPALRCVQTATAIVKGLGNPYQLCIEPGLFEWLAWYPRLPRFISLDDLAKFGLVVDRKYSPQMKMAELETGQGKETIQEYYERTERVVKQLMETTALEGTVLVVAHGATLDAGARALLELGAAPISEGDMAHMGIHFPYLSTLILTQQSSNGQWAYVHDLLPPINYVDFCNCPNARFVNRGIDDDAE